MIRETYTEGDYLTKNPTWHTEDSPWKAEQIVRMMRRNRLTPKTICEVGCGAGEILRQLQQRLDKDCLFWGYEISPQAFALCKQRANERLRFELKDILQDKDAFFDLIVLIDLIEHLEDYFSFLRGVKPKSVFKILHIPLDLSVQMVLRGSPIMRTRESVGHLHYFTKEIALAILRDVGYEVLDWFYVELPLKSVNRYIAYAPRRLFFAIHEDLAVQIMGGYSLMVLAQ